MNNKNKFTDNSEFRTFFIEQMRDIYGAEKALIKALPKLRDASTSPRLAAAFDKHIQDTEWQIELVKRVFELLGEKPESVTCEAMEGLVKEAQTVIDDTEKDSYTRDAGLILAGQKVEHYEIATYGTLRIFAGHMGEEEVKKNLEKILENEKETDVNLTVIAETYINEKAAEE